MGLKICSTLFITLLFFAISFSTSHAARSFVIEANKSALFGDEEMVITASASGFTNGENIYIKGAFYQDGSTNYFGYTKSGDAWIKNGASTTSQRQIKIGDWDGRLIIKADFSDSGYKGEGSYKFKLGYYYGSFSSVNWSSNILDVNISEPDPTATPTQIPATPTLQVINTPKSPTEFLVNVLTPSIKPNPSKMPTLHPSKIDQVHSIMGEATKSATKKISVSKIPKKENDLEKNESKQQDMLSSILVLIGGALIASCGILIFVRRKRE